MRHEAMTSRSVRAARLAVLAIFFLSGFGFGNWAVRIPAVQERLGLGEGLLGVALLGMAAGSLVSMPLAGGLISRLGSRRVVGATALAYSVMLPLLAVAPNLALLVTSLTLVGAATGSLDVSMNAQAVAVEKGLGRPIMSSFHAAFSLGGLAGAAAGGAVAAAGIGVAPHLAGVAALSLAAFVLAYGRMLPAGADRGEDGEPAFARPTRALAGLGVIAFCVLLGEGAMADWSAVYLSGTLGTGPGFAAAGFAAFSATMVAGRLLGDRLIARFGPAALVRAGGIVSAVGLGVSLAVAHPVAALVGFGCAGLGFSIIFPAALSAAGRAESTATGPAIAAVATAGYFGFLVGPPSIGFVAEVIGLGGALFIVVALSAAIVFLAGSVGRGYAKRKKRPEA
ncbi:MAG TPA: MFS transporter [Rubrobacteraceae bacterium]|nr:MFS transporter [Rubrobacteraceae bacterium]